MQCRFAGRVLAVVDNALADYGARNEAAADACRATAIHDNRAAVCLGPPGTGKSHWMHHCIE